ncbi:MAG: GGDEF domain-containing protein [Gemmatimonadota bacterium]
MLIHGVRAAVRAVLRVLVPEGALLLVLLALPLAPTFARVERLVPLLLVAAAGTAAAVGWRFRRSHLVYGVALTAGAATLGFVPDRVSVLAVPFSLLNLALLAGLRERGPTSPRAFAFGLGLIGQAAFLGWVEASGATVAPVPIPGFPPFTLAHLAAGVAFAILGSLALARSDAVIHGLFWAAVAVLLTAGPPGLIPGPETWPALAGVLVLLVAGLEEAHRLAYHDGLTGLPSRRALNERLQRTLGGYTVAMVDVDHFKRVNDRHGHDVGDQVLRMVATRLRGTPGARVYRYGGEEFTLVFPGRDVDDVRPILDRVRERVADPPFVIRGSERPAEKPARRLFLWRDRQNLAVTVSVGAAQRTGWRQSPAEVVRAAAPGTGPALPTRVRR